MLIELLSQGELRVRNKSNQQFIMNCEFNDQNNTLQINLKKSSPTSSSDNSVIIIDANTLHALLIMFCKELNEDYDLNTDDYNYAWDGNGVIIKSSGYHKISERSNHNNQLALAISNMVKGKKRKPELLPVSVPKPDTNESKLYTASSQNPAQSASTSTVSSRRQIRSFQSRNSFYSKSFGALFSSEVNNSAMELTDDAINRECNQIMDLDTAKAFLNKFIYQVAGDKPAKDEMISIVIKAFVALMNNSKNRCQNNSDYISHKTDVCGDTSVIDELAGLYRFINEQQYKDMVNTHRNPKLDRWLGINNTQSWQDMIGDIRELSQHVLVEEAGSRFKADAKSRIEFLQKHCKEDLFAEHRSNNCFNFFHKTRTVQEVNMLIKIIKDEDANIIKKMNNLQI